VSNHRTVPTDEEIERRPPAQASGKPARRFPDEEITGEPIEPGGSYAYEPDRGPVRSSRGDLLVSGRTLLDLAADDYTRAETRDEARYLMRALIGQRLHGQVLHTRNVLMELTDL